MNKFNVLQKLIIYAVKNQKGITGGSLPFYLKQGTSHPAQEVAERSNCKGEHCAATLSRMFGT